MQNSRRHFLKQAGIGALGAYFGSSLLSACQTANKAISATGPLQNIGLQIYSLRDLLNQDPKLTLETVAKIGYTNIETFGVDVSNNTFWGVKVPELKKILSDNGLSTFSGHYDLSKYLDRNNNDKESIEKYVEIAAELGQHYVIAPVNPMHDLNNLKVEDYQYAAEQLNKAGEIAKKSGLKIGYHNHFWEFRQFANNTRGLDIMLAFTEKDLVAFELDLYWIEKAGLNPISYIDKYPGRFEMWHVKDMDKQFTNPVIGEKYDHAPLDSIFKEVRYTELGTGNIDFVNIAKAAQKSGLVHAFVEQDDIYMPNKFESVKKSYDYVQKYLAK
ncbi:sugar phosphate isomerase/epimerase family protein [Sphingobacterium bovistauri]|uniref:Sugar phosphate isomerase/epimerase n=1 Tax=Sphingobacterium bovistauri TaxID=2781959 RepID=A0ABS7Z4M9_9SPHI|nr:sugar phosphate isomerase/epimerase [Sphingobacterium bovistauri]MCA5004517.1 sugar phosphate isomerase/epimerase [Sphingobacterium bovistauri]